MANLYPNPYADPFLEQVYWTREDPISGKTLREEEEDIEYHRQKVDPLYKLDKAEAMRYATKMGSSDTARGIAQLFGKAGEYFGADGLTNALKKKDDKLRAIFNSPEYGNQALATFLASAVAADPVTYLPIIGWISKGKKAKTLWDFTKYGATAAAVIGGAGYTPEEYSLLSHLGVLPEDTSFLAKKLEQTGLASVTGGVLTGTGGKLIDVIQRARGKGSIFDGPDEILTKKSANDKLLNAEAETANIEPLKIGQIVRARDRNNIGTIMALDEKEGIATVRFVNKKNGTSATKKFSTTDLRPNKFINRKPLSEKDSKVERTDGIFVIDDKTHPLINLYKARDRAKGITWTIGKALDEDGKVIKGQWEIIATTEKRVVYTQRLPGKGKETTKVRIDYTDSEPIVVGSLTKAKAYVNEQINPSVLKTPKSKKELLNNLGDEGGKQKHKLSNPINNYYNENFGYAALNAMRNNLGETIGFGGGMSYGWNAVDDPEATMLEKFGMGLFYGSVAAGSIKGMKFADKNFNNQRASNFFSSMIVSDYGLKEPYRLLRHKFRTDRNKIAGEFGDLVQRAQKELTPEQNKLLWSFMSGEMYDMHKLTPEALSINATARTAITKYAQELVDMGILNKQVFLKNRDIYLKRSYLRNLKIENPFKKFSKKDQQVKDITFESSKQIRIIGDELRPRGIVERNVDKAKFLKSDSKYQKEGGWEIINEYRSATTNKLTGKVSIRKDYTKEQRVQMGEIEDAAYAFRETGRLLSNDVSAARFFNNLAKDKRFAIDKATWKSLPPDQKVFKDGSNKWVLLSDANIKGTNKPRYGELGGMYVERFVARDIKHIFKLAEQGENGALPFLRGLDKIQTVWKKFKTSYSPPTHGANFLSNFMLYDFADAKYKYLWQAAKEMWKGDKSKLYREAKEAGIFDVNLVTKELNDYGPAMEQALVKMIDDPSPYSFMGYQTNFWTKIKKIPKKMEDLYMLEDGVFRFGIYLDRIKGKKVSTEEAALDARKWVIDYDINAPLINALKRTAIPFISYGYRVIPLLAEAAVLRPHKYVKWAMVVGGANLAGQLITGEDDEIDRLAMKESEQKKMFGIDIMPLTNIRMPFNSEHGDPLYFDIQRLTPGGDIFEQRSQETGIPGVPVSFQFGGLWYDLLYSLISKRDPFTGQEIEGIDQDGDVIKDVIAPILKNQLKKIPPNVTGIPGTFNTERMQKALRARRRGREGDVTNGTPYAADYGIWEALAYNVGIRLKPQNADANIALKRTLFEQQYNKEINNIRDAEKKYDREQISEEAKDEKIAKASLKIVKLGAEWDYFERQLAAAQYRKSQRLEKKSERNKKFKGGAVSEDYPVPNVIKDPSERVDPYTGQPYDAEMERLGMKDGLMVSIGVAPVSEKQIDKLKKALEKRKAKRDGGYTREQYRFGDRIRERLDQRRERREQRVLDIGEDYSGLFSYKMQDKDYDRWLKKLGDLDKPAMQSKAYKWADKKHVDYPTFDKEALANAYLHAISSYELSTDTPEGGEGDKGFQKLWRSKARQVGMQVKEMRQKGEALLGNVKNPYMFFEAQRDTLNNSLGITAYNKHRQDKDKAYAYIDNKFTTRLDELINNSPSSLNLTGKPIINAKEELEPDLWQKNNN
jgi:hypothetical protein